MPSTILGPTAEPAVNGLSGTEALGQIALGGSDIEDPQDAVDDGAMIGPLPSTIGTLGQRGGHFR